MVDELMSIWKPTTGFHSIEQVHSADDFRDGDSDFDMLFIR